MTQTIGNYNRLRVTVNLVILFFFTAYLIAYLIAFIHRCRPLNINYMALSAFMLSTCFIGLITDLFHWFFLYIDYKHQEQDLETICEEHKKQAVRNVMKARVVRFSLTFTENSIILIMGVASMIAITIDPRFNAKNITIGSINLHLLIGIMKFTLMSFPRECIALFGVHSKQKIRQSEEPHYLKRLTKRDISKAIAAVIKTLLGAMALTLSCLAYWQVISYPLPMHMILNLISWSLSLSFFAYDVFFYNVAWFSGQSVPVLNHPARLAELTSDQTTKTDCIDTIDLACCDHVAPSPSALTLTG